jgi:hypothetical protein
VSEATINIVYTLSKEREAITVAVIATSEKYIDDDKHQRSEDSLLQETKLKAAEIKLQNSEIDCSLYLVVILDN